MRAVGQVLRHRNDHDSRYPLYIVPGLIISKELKPKPVTQTDNISKQSTNNIPQDTSDDTSDDTSGSETDSDSSSSQPNIGNYDSSDDTSTSQQPIPTKNAKSNGNSIRGPIIKLVGGGG